MHGLSHTPVYRAWANIKTRCNDTKAINYKYYGGRGIKICDRWLTFINFWEDMKESYKKGLTLDRINNNGNYEPSNCRWATMKEQTNHRRNNHLFTFNGVTKTLAQWSEIMGINRETLRLKVNAIDITKT